tara:strand:+ start:2579 stop:2911 length:333 start_codon:yes stop_codon:yes gene_type:complete
MHNKLEKNYLEVQNQIDAMIAINLLLKDTYNKIINLFSELEYQIQAGLSLRESLTSQTKIELVDTKISELQLEKIKTQENIDSLSHIMNKGQQMLKAAQAMLSELKKIRN